MKNKTLFTIILITLILVITAISGCVSRPYTPSIRDEQENIIEGSIALLESIELGGMNQWVQIRGHNTSDPILLWLHGGPGSAQMPIGRFYNEKLEEHFIVVHWDQRGAGKSNPKDFDENTMSLAQYVQDGYELTQYLKEKFNKTKIFLLGHSWGTYIGLKLSTQYPEDYYAYIAQGQVLNFTQACLVGYDWLKERIEEAGSERDRKIIDKLGDPPYVDHSDYVTFIKMIESYGGGMDISMIELLPKATKATEYTARDYLNWLNGANRGAGPMWEEYIQFDLPSECPEIQIPIYFLSGLNDYNTPIPMVIDYYEQLEAPMGKHLIVFENCSHAPCLGKPKLFNQRVIESKQEVLECRHSSDKKHHLIH